jgi:hypothetical protein
VVPRINLSPLRAEGFFILTGKEGKCLKRVITGPAGPIIDYKIAVFKICNDSWKLNADSF